MRMFKALFATLILVLGFAAPLAAGPLEDAVAAYRKGDYATARELLRPLAEQGHAGAQSNLGIKYTNGEGVPQNYSEALKWYRRAAEQHLALAQYNLGVSYHKGEGVTQNYSEAIKWYRRA